MPKQFDGFHLQKLNLLSFVFRGEKSERLMEIFVELTVRKMGLGRVEGDAFVAYPDFNLVSLVVEHTLEKAWPDVRLCTLEVSWV